MKVKREVAICALGVIGLLILFCVAVVAHAASPAREVTAACPKGFAVYANAWTREAVCAASSDLCAKSDALINAAAARDSENASNPNAYKPSSFSRTLSDELIRDVRVRASIGNEIAAQLLDPITLNVVRDLGPFRFVDGIAEISLTADQRDFALQTIWPAFFSSPTVSGGKRRLILFPEEWKNKNGGRYCTMQVHGEYKTASRP